jgi:hypothetical protein
MNDYRERRTERMIANYAARLRAGQVGMRRDGLTQAQEERFAAGVERAKRLRAETITVLDAADAPSILRPFYCSFAHKLAKINRNGWCERAKREEGMLLMQTWAVRGLRREVMLEVARKLFGLDLTGSQPPCAAAGTGVESGRE